jgi:YggT family protein
MGYLGQAGVYLIETLFGLYIFAVLLRFLMQLTRADFYNPIAQFLVLITNPPLLPLRRVLPGLWGIDWASVLLLAILQTLKFYLLFLLQGHIPQPAGFAVLVLADFLQLLVYFYLITIVIRVLISWVNPDPHNPLVALLVRLTEPLLRPARRMIPPVGGFDLSPIAALILLQLTLILAVRPLFGLARVWAG